MASQDGALPYGEPDIVTILITASFLLALNASDRALDKLVYCGLVGQIFIGIAFGAPGLQWLPLDFQKVTEQLGYLGLILLVYEGGLSTKLRILRSNILLSFMIAVTGVATPIALSFVLQSMLSITSLQAFAAGAALSSTSLGTIFTVLQSSGLSQNHLEPGPILTGFVASASYAGTSNLFAAYLAGACLSWYDEEFGPVAKAPMDKPVNEHGSSGNASQTPTAAGVTAPERTKQNDQKDTVQNEEHKIIEAVHCSTALEIYEHYYAAVVNRILRPFFFASVGFSIPITRMFDGQLVWRGLIYALLMGIGKLTCGLWLVRFSISLPRLPAAKQLMKAASSIALLFRHQEQAPRGTALQPDAAAVAASAVAFSTTTVSDTGRRHRQWISKPQSLYPAAILGSAMISRGEIGFLISAVAQSSGLFDAAPGSTGPDLFLVVTWAVMLCTIVGPIATGLLTKRVWRLQECERSKQSGRQDPLGVWGVSQVS
ncbi:hypothetical protein AMS68_001888 [Peltaster fructicola]|uniref:Cation/H+ exchanger transmembrane domain-containing protein n=1 Tax=Peltaster fructicola TaxID=286661 RepID=A0A6H0XNY8_9PEZI|nr:hypothetical protein AMS68_001888 [Peltaster fructicola]